MNMNSSVSLCINEGSTLKEVEELSCETLHVVQILAIDRITKSERTEIETKLLNIPSSSLNNVDGRLSAEWVSSFKSLH